MLSTYLASLPWPLLGTVFSSGFVFGLVFALVFFTTSPHRVRKD
ncbi:MAG TPA: hypothetical protein PK530_23340 [Anaerolineales bacterium]|nr:hypothetical protein [Anaerolineales bacterium]